MMVIVFGFLVYFFLFVIFIVNYVMCIIIFILGLQRQIDDLDLVNYSILFLRMLFKIFYIG